MAKKKNKVATTGQYDKVFKENADEIHLAIINRLFQNSIGKVQTEDVPQSDLQYTIERKADFLKKIVPFDGSPPYCLHIEIQSDNDDKMEWRMYIYRGLVSHKYQLGVAQFVVYIGNESLNMKAKIAEEKLHFAYEIVDIRSYNYEEFLNTNTPEQVVLAVLGNFHGEEPATVIERILQRLKELTTTELAFGKYATQLEVISELRKLRKIAKTQINNMPVVFDYTATTAFEKGEAKGKKEVSFGMFEEGFLPEIVARITKLPLETIEAWRKEWEASTK